jgi:hypothetical protein
MNNHTPLISNINSNTNINPSNRTLNDLSQFNMGNVHSDFTGNQENSDSGYLNRNFESHLDEIFDNLTYLITTEK